MARHRRGYFPSACAKKLLALRPGRQGDKRLRKRGPLLSFSPKEPQRKLDGSRNVSLTECHFSDGGPLHLRVKIQSSHVMPLSAGSFPQSCPGRQRQGGFHAGLHIPGMESPWVPVWPKGRLCTFLATWMPDGQERTSIPDKTLRSGWGGLTNLSRARPFSSPLPLKWRRKV